MIPQIDRVLDRIAPGRYHLCMRVLGIVSALAIGALAACGGGSGSAPEPAKPKQNPFDAFPNSEPKVGDPAPGFELKTLDGTAVSLAEATARGHVVLVFGSFS